MQNPLIEKQKIVIQDSRNSEYLDVEDEQAAIDI
jgi:hypothetical protein